MQGRRFLTLAALLAALGAIHALVYLPLVSPHETGDSPYYTAAAHALLDGGYSTPLGRMDITGLEFHGDLPAVEKRETFRTPGYPLFLALLGGGTSDVSKALVMVVQALLTGASVFLLALCIRRLWGAGAALAAAAVYAIDPFSKRYAALFLSEALSTFLFLAAAYAFVEAWERRSTRWWGACGAICGALVLVRPVFVFLPFLVLPALALRRDGWAAFARRAAVYAAAAGLLVAPWLAWQLHVLGRPVLQSFGTGWGFLYAAHGEGHGRTGGDVANDPDFQRDFYSVHRLAPPPAVLRRDPDAYGRYLVRADAEQRRIARTLYAERLRERPARVVWESLYRSYFLWMAHEDWRQPTGAALLLLRLLDWLVLMLAAAGAVLALRRPGASRAFAVLLVLFTLASGLGHVEARYSIPLRGLFLALATYAALGLLRRAREALAARKAQIQTLDVATLPTDRR